MKLLHVLLVAFLLLDAGLIGWHLALDRRGNRPKNPQGLPTPTQTLVDPLVAGVSKKDVDGKQIAELTGWVDGVDLEKQTLAVGQPGTPLRNEISFDSSTVLRKAVKNGDTLSHAEKTIDDLVPQRTRVVVLCADLECQKASIITIIEER